MARQLSAKRPKDLRFTVSELLGYMGRHRFLLFTVAALVTVSACANLLGTYMIRPVVNSLAGADVSALVRGVAATALIYGAGVLSAFGYTQTMVNMAQKVLFDIRRDLFAHIQTLLLRFFDTRRHGDVMSYFTNDVDTVSDALNNSFAMVIQSFIQIVGTLAMLFVLNWRLSLLVVVGYAAMFWYIRYSGARSKAYFTRQQASLGELDGYMEEMVSGQKVVKVFNHEAENQRIFGEKNDALRKAGTGAQSYAATMIPAVVTISYINYALVAVLGGMMALRGMTDIGSLASYLVFVRQAALPINQFTQQSNLLLAALAGAERIFQIMDEPSEAPDVPKAVRMASARGDICMKDVCFSYEPGKPVLKHVSMHVRPGERIGLVGATGAGKTTILNMLPRFYDIASGEITIDGVRIECIARDDLRRLLAIVLQDTHLFTGTVADNIRFGNLDATDDDIVRAAKLTSAHSFIKRLPHGYDTMLENDGENLSQGQRQLLNIARAAVANPSVLLLDEATSNIDTRSEMLIQRGLDKLMEGRTSFVIAHRLSTVRTLDRILVLENGEIIEEGNHAELMARKGYYYRLYCNQFE